MIIWLLYRLLYVITAIDVTTTTTKWEFEKKATDPDYCYFKVTLELDFDYC